MDLTDSFTMTTDQFIGLNKRQKALVKHALLMPGKDGKPNQRVKVTLKKKVKFYEFPRKDP